MILLGFGLGFLIFALEFCFALIIQAFLYTTGISSEISDFLKNLPGLNLVNVLIVFVGIGLLRALTYWAQIYTRSAAAEQFRYRQRSRLIHWAFENSSASTTEVSTLFTERTGSAANAVMYLQSELTEGTIALSVAITLLVLSPKLALVAFGVLSLLIIPFRKIGNRVRNLGGDVLNEWDNTNQKLLVSIRNILLLRIYGIEKKEEEIAQSTLRKYRDNSLSYLLLAGMNYASSQFYGVTIIAGITFLAKKYDWLSGPALLTFFYLFIRLVQNASQASISHTNAMFAFPQLVGLAVWWAKNSHDRMGAPAEQSRNRKYSDKIQKPVGWRMKDLAFRYPGEGKDLIQNLNLEILPSSLTVIQGPSGAGKSTLLNLILGQLNPTSGKVEVSIGENWENLSHICPTFSTWWGMWARRVSSWKERFETTFSMD